MNDLTDEIRAMLRNRISERLSDGWYPSSRHPETGEVRHDRHVLIWVRQYEAKLSQALGEIERLRSAINDWGRDDLYG